MSTILQEAELLIDGIKREEYGDLKKSFAAIAKIWTELIKLRYPQWVSEYFEMETNFPALLMDALKSCRQANKHKRDNILDKAGYTKCLAILTGEDNAENTGDKEVS